MASSAPAMSAQAIGGAESGLISAGRVRGMNRISANTATTSSPMKTIGSQACRNALTSG